MKEVKPHETLLCAGTLHEFQPELGSAAFVSHQWASRHHPDPEMKQFKVLQAAVANLLSGACQIQADCAYEVMLGLAQIAAATKALRSQRPEKFYIWYDFFSCPQLENKTDGTVSLSTSSGVLSKAIESIPSYITRCDFFLALTPTIEGESTVINELTWASRGWCLLEKCVWDLSGRGGSCIVIKSPMHCEMNFWTAKPPGKGQFSFQEDKRRILGGFQKLIRSRLRLHLTKFDYINFRLLLNQQKYYLRDLCQNAQDSLMEASGHSDAEDQLVSAFLHKNSLPSATFRDASGWSALCYAAQHGDPAVLRALLVLRGNPNERTTKSRDLDQTSKKMPLLSICTRYEHLDAMKLLIQHRAAVNVKGIDQPPLHVACAQNSPEAIHLLCDAGADTRLRTFMGVSPVTICACTPAPEALQELLKRQGDADLSGSPLFLSAMTRGSTQTTQLLLEARADLDERWAPPMTDPFGLLCKVKAIEHRMKRMGTRLTTLAYHHYRATPLMAAIICGNFEMAAVLIDEGARLDLKNSRGKTAFDFAREMSAPDFVLDAFEGDMTKCASLASAASTSPSPRSPRSSRSMRAKPELNEEYEDEGLVSEEF